MSYKPKNRPISVRLKNNLVEYIDNVLPQTDFSNRTQLIQYACFQYCIMLQQLLLDKDNTNQLKSANSSKLAHSKYYPHKPG